MLLDTRIRVFVGLVVNYTLRVMGFGVIIDTICNQQQMFI
jgi:hypothetical protein